MHSVMEMKKMVSKMELCQKLRTKLRHKKKAINNAKVKKENAGKWCTESSPRFENVPSIFLRTKIIDSSVRKFSYNEHSLKTRMHSSRMRTARLRIVPGCWGRRW